MEEQQNEESEEDRNSNVQDADDNHSEEVKVQPEVHANVNEVAVVAEINNRA